MIGGSIMMKDLEIVADLKGFNKHQAQQKELFYGAWQGNLRAGERREEWDVSLGRNCTFDAKTNNI